MPMPPTASGEHVEFVGAGVRLTGDRWRARVGDTDRPRGTVLLLHGGGQTRHSWFRTADAVAAAGWTSIALDARGHSDSDWSPDGDYSVDAMIDDLAAVANQLDERPVLVGASMGGMVSLVGQGERGDLARALVLVDIAPTIEPVGVKKIMDFMSANPNGFADLDEVSEAVRAYNPRRKRAPSTEGLRKNVRQGADGRWRWHWDPAFLVKGDEPRRDIDADRSRAAASRISVPTLLIRGEQSDIVSTDGAAELLALVPGSEYLDIPGTGHMVAGDDNDVFSRRVIEFLGRIPDE